MDALNPDDDSRGDANPRRAPAQAANLSDPADPAQVENTWQWVLALICCTISVVLILANVVFYVQWRIDFSNAALSHFPQEPWYWKPKVNWFLLVGSLGSLLGALIAALTSRPQRRFIVVTAIAALACGTWLNAVFILFPAGTTPQPSSSRPACAVTESHLPESASPSVESGVQNGDRSRLRPCQNQPFVGTSEVLTSNRTVSAQLT